MTHRFPLGGLRWVRRPSWACLRAPSDARHAQMGVPPGAGLAKFTVADNAERRPAGTSAMTTIEGPIPNRPKHRE